MIIKFRSFIWLFIFITIIIYPINNNFFFEICISEANIENCKIAVVNKSNLTIAILEQNYEQHIQIIELNQKYMLKQFS